MHVLLISSNDLNERYTYASIFELAQAKALRAQGIKVAILSVGYYTTSNIAMALAHRTFFMNYEYYRFKDLSYSQLLYESVKSLSNTSLSRTKVRKIKVQDVTVYEALFNDLYFTLSERGHKKWVKHGYEGFTEYVKDHGVPDIIHAHSRFLLAGLLANEIKERNNIPYVLTSHSSFYKRNLIKDFQLEMIRNVFGASDKSLAVSASLAEDANEKMGTSFDFEIIPNILDESFENITCTPRPCQEFVFLNVARLDENKNQQLLIRAFAGFVKKGAQAVLRIAGNGPELENLQNLAINEGVADKVFFLGHLSHEQVLQEMVDCDVFCLSSFYETFGVVVIEALACGKPVIVTRCGGPSEIINKDNGLRVKSDDITGMKEAMLYMHKHAGNYNAEMIRENCLSKYGGRHVAQKLLNIYQTVLD